MDQVYLALVGQSAEPPVVIPPTTKILDGTTTQHLASISEDGAEFIFSQSMPALETPEPGDIILYPKLSVVVGVEGKVSYGIRTGITYEATMKGGRGVSRMVAPISEFNSKFTPRI